MRDNLRSVFETKSWAAIGGAPRSGPGSDMAATARLRAALPDVFERYGVKTMFDAPCGDWFWMQHVDLTGITYIGADISGELVAENQSRFTAPNLRFRHLDITSDPLPQSDLMLCRDCLFHLKFWLRWKVLENFVASGSRFLMLTMHHVAVNNPVKVNGGFQRFNPMMAPFNFTAPIEMIHETADQPDGANHDHRSLGIWSRDQVVDALSRRITLAEETATTSG